MLKTSKNQSFVIYYLIFAEDQTPSYLCNEIIQI